MPCDLEGLSDVKQRASWPRAVFFDVGETLVRPRRTYGELLTEVSQTLGISLSVEIAGGLAKHADVRVAERTQQRLPFTFPAEASQQFWFETYHGFFSDYLSATNARRLAHGLLELLSSPSGYVCFEDTISTLEALHADGHRLGIISNWEAWLPALLDGAGLTPFFDHIVASGVCGIEKPDVGIFTLAMEQGGYRPGEVIYVGDRPAHDVAPAQSAGMVPILLDRAERYAQHGVEARIGCLHELFMALEATQLARKQGLYAPSDQ